MKILQNIVGQINYATTIHMFHFRPCRSKIAIIATPELEPLTGFLGSENYMYLVDMSFTDMGYHVFYLYIYIRMKSNLATSHNKRLVIKGEL